MCGSGQSKPSKQILEKRTAGKNSQRPPSQINNTFEPESQQQIDEMLKNENLREIFKRATVKHFDKDYDYDENYWMEHLNLKRPSDIDGGFRRNLISGLKELSTHKGYHVS